VALSAADWAFGAAVASTVLCLREGTKLLRRKERGGRDLSEEHRRLLNF
jgi:hypothetical protein